ncbi:hypothetical protein CK203_105529 [Vitis vinifera]|uniref:Uncharacterized protein n=1 Tax=Vitis vinifera TaxID=29760 RepID=A0A438BQJ8_VITVI|nr:hypothetical protein CK203_105529 [Vitis vinifera]
MHKPANQMSNASVCLPTLMFEPMPCQVHKALRPYAMDSHHGSKALLEEEEATILELQEELGNKWTTIAKRLPGRTDTGIKNFWNNWMKSSSCTQMPALHAGYRGPQVCPRNPDGIGCGPTSIPNASSIPALEVNPAEQDSDCFLEELLRDQEPSDRFMENNFT